MNDDKVKLTQVEAKGIAPKQIEKLRSMLYDTVVDALEILRAGMLDQDFRGKKLKRNQIYAASPMLRFAPNLDNNLDTGAVHLHLSVPRPSKEAKIKTIKGKVVKSEK